MLDRGYNQYYISIQYPYKSNAISELLLSGKMCTFAHVTSVFFPTSKVTKEAEILQEGFSLIFIIRKTFTGQQ